MADLLTAWAEARDLPEEQRTRWRAAGFLHDALRQAERDELAFWTERDWDPALLHGPACAERLREEGVEDGELLRAITYHTLGHPDLDDLGRHLYLADFLEPGREILPDVRERLRTLLPDEPLEALLSVVALRIAHRLEVRGTIRPETVAFWNRLLAEAGEAGAGGGETGAAGGETGTAGAAERPGDAGPGGEDAA